MDHCNWEMLQRSGGYMGIGTRKTPNGQNTARYTLYISPISNSPITARETTLNPAESHMRGKILFRKPARMGHRKSPIKTSK